MKQYLGIAYSIKNMPELDDGFIPLGVWMRAYEQLARTPIAIAVEAAGGRVVVRHTNIIADGAHQEADYRYVERLVKFMLWSVGGFRVYICGAADLGRRISRAYRPTGERGFDAQFMRDVYERELEVCCRALEDCPAECGGTISIGGHLEGCRIGFDAGGSDRKVSAVIDGEPVYTEEVVWTPKTESDPQYHFQEIVAAFQTAASKMPRVDAIGVSSAGVFVGNSPMVSSLFIKVPREKRPFVKAIFNNAAKEIGDGKAPVAVANDGDVTALAGSMELKAGSVMGIAMGTSEAVGYVNAEGNILGWFNELAFAPVDLSECAMRDEWSGDVGVGSKYFSQDAVIKLAPKAGIALADNLTPAQKLARIQKLPHDAESGAARIFRSIGAYLAHTILLYSSFYDIRHLLVLGRVLSGKGGSLIVSECNRILTEEYPELAEQVKVILPDEKSRRVGQSIAAASLPA